MARFTTDLKVTTPKSTVSSQLTGEYTDIFSFNQVLDNNNGMHTIMTNLGNIGSLTLSDCKTLLIKNSGSVGAEIHIDLNEWLDDTPDTDVSAISYVSTLLASGDFMFLPNLRMLQFNANTSAADAYTLDNQVPDSNMYIAVNNPAAGDAQLAAEAIDGTETAIDVDDASFFYVGDIIRVENEVMEVTGIASNTLTVIRGVYGSAKATHSDDSALRFSFFNAYADYDKYSTSQTDSSGRFKCSNFFGYARTEGDASGLVAGSVSGKFYSAGYQELGMSGITASTESGLAASTAYAIDIACDGGSDHTLAFTTGTSTKFGGSSGILRKIQDALDVQYYTTSSNLLDKRVTAGIVNGDIRFTSGQRLSTSAISITAPASGTTIFGVGRFVMAVGAIEAPVAARLPDDVIYNRKTNISSPNVSAMFYDDGRGNISGACTGTINYETGAIDIIGCPPNANFVVSGNYGSAHSGGNKFAVANANSIIRVEARSTNPKINTTIEVMALK